MAILHSTAAFIFLLVALVSLFTALELWQDDKIAAVLAVVLGALCLIVAVLAAF